MALLKNLIGGILDVSKSLGETKYPERQQRNIDSYKEKYKDYYEWSLKEILESSTDADEKIAIRQLLDNK